MSSDGNVANLMGLGRTALLAGNNEEALGYFNRVLESNPQYSDAWLGKGKAAAWQSSLVNIRINEALIAFSHAIATAEPERKGAVTAEVVDEANRITTAVYSMARRHLDEFVALENSWTTYLGQMSQLLSALEQIRSWDPINKNTLENIVHLCKDNIEGISYRSFDNTPQAWHLSPAYENELKAKLDSAVSDLRTLDSSYSPPQLEKKQADACFVITATMGDADHPTVRLMREWRDECLLTSWTGRRLTSLYYRYGPRAAKVIASSRLRRGISYWLLVRPAARLASIHLQCKRGL